MRTIVPIGKQFNYLKVIEDMKAEKGVTKVKVECRCGNNKIVSLSHLLSGHTKSCGCLGKEILVQKFRKHGQSKTKIHYIWLGIKQRCCNSKNKNFYRYGGRGIKMCDKWEKSFECFSTDMGPRPNGATIERIDNNGNYEPGNCRWATMKEQGNNKRNNKRILFLGKMMTTSEVSDITGTPYMKVYDRMVRVRG